MADKDKPRGGKTAAAAAALGERFAALGATAAPAPAPAPAPARERRPRQRGSAKPATMPAEQPKTLGWPARISLMTSPEMKRDLDMARVNDGIEVTARIRAMIELWQTDERHRARVDKLARERAEQEKIARALQR